jgi:hypothetical protein
MGLCVAQGEFGLIAVQLAAFRALHASAPAAKPIETTTTDSAGTPITTLAKHGSNQLSLETPQNRAGVFTLSRSDGGRAGNTNKQGCGVLQNMFCHPLTKLRTGRANLPCGP